MAEGGCNESERGRVRRIVIDPLSNGGMRFKKGTDPAKAAEDLARIADELKRLSDSQLVSMRNWMEVNGGGSARCFWPSFVSIAGMAQMLVPRPIEDFPELASWFRSRAGEAAMAIPGRAVVELRFMQAKRRPPVARGEADEMDRRARRLWADVQRAEELRRCSRPHDAGLLDAYNADLARVDALVSQGIAKRSAEGATS